MLNSNEYLVLIIKKLLIKKFIFGHYKWILYIDNRLIIIETTKTLNICTLIILVVNHIIVNVNINNLKIKALKIVYV